MRNAVNLVYLWLARCRSRFMRDVLHQSVELSSLFLQTAVMLGSQTFVVLCACAILRWQLGTRWRYGLTSRYVWQRLFWLGLVTPIGIKCSMYLVGSFFDFPLKISTFFGDADAIFTVVDLLSLFTAVLIYNMLFYYLTRMIVSPHFAQILWRRDIARRWAKRNAHLP